MINRIDPDELRGQVRSATPFPHCSIENFFEREFAGSVARAFPSFEEARKVGLEFNTVNEKKKIQVNDVGAFAAPIAQVHRLLTEPSFVSLLSRIFDIPNLLTDDQLIGGGIHEMAPQGRLDVHVDFNYIRDRRLHRRLNLLVYLNQDWDAAWGGDLELWDRDVRRCERSFTPVFNRCVVFATTNTSYHGVAALKCPPDRRRLSFAAYYYTREAPPDWKGHIPATQFRGRPDEKLKTGVLMPFERAGSEIRQAIRRVKRMIRP